MLDIQNQLAESRIWCERRMEQLLDAMEKNKGAATKRGNAVLPRYSDIGLNKMQSHRWRVLAKGTDDGFRAVIEDIKGGDARLLRAPSR